MGNSIVEGINSKVLDAKAARVLKRAGLAGEDGDTQQSLLAARAMLAAGGTEELVAQIFGQDDWKRAFQKLDKATAGGTTAEQAAEAVLADSPATDEPGTSAVGGLDGVTTTARKVSKGEGIFANMVGGGAELLDAFGTFSNEHPALAGIGLAGVSAVVGGPTKTFLKRLAGEAGDSVIERSADAFGGVVGRAVTALATKNKWTIGFSLMGHATEADANSIGLAAGTLGSVGVETVAGAGVGQIADRVKDLRAKVNNRWPINYAYAGKVYDGKRWTPELAAKYPEGVRFNELGRPDFSPYQKAGADFDNLTGDYNIDEGIALRHFKLKSTPEDYTWHHVEGGRRLILIPRDIHDAVRHTGGAADIRSGATK